MDGGWRLGWDGRPVGGACRHDESLCSWREAVLVLCLLVCLTLCLHDGGNIFNVSRSRREITEEYRESSVILWCVGGGRGVVTCPSSEPDTHVFFCAKKIAWRKWSTVTLL